MQDSPLYTLDPLNRFTERADDYVKHRPSYPAEAIDVILTGLAPASQILAADIGAGTGIASRLLAERGVKVIAVEPNAAMREVAQTHKNVEYRNGSAEATNLPDASVDLVTAFQAFHWFNPEPTLLEFRRILKPTGRLAVVWNNFDKDDDFTLEYSNFIHTISNNHRSKSRQIAVESLKQTQYFSNYCEYQCKTYRQELDLDGLIGRAMSISYVPREGESHESLISGLQHLYQQFRDERGFVYIAYQTNVYILS
ncbi:type 11 methyltransferase [Calothrix sp. NIES-4071]|nr:type 11 methyltransferase [Calothrix sp. NIES-4071]BAZ61879.1 type 11 methyltransferase [Calothrix sp. NIES-4105]